MRSCRTQCSGERKIEARTAPRQIRTQTTPVRRMNLNDVTPAALPALRPHRHGEKREPCHNIFERSGDPILILRTRLILLRWRRVICSVLWFVLLRMLLRRLCISIVLRGSGFLQLIGKIILLLLRRIPVTRRRQRLLLLLRAAHPMHEHEYRSLLHIFGHDERSARQCCNRACRLNQIELRTVADTVRTRSTGSCKAKNG